MKPKTSHPADNQRPDRAKSVTFWIREADHARLKEFAQEHDLSVSNVINRALKRFLDDPEPFNHNRV